MKSVDDVDNCCGCGGCTHVCPKGAVKICVNGEGFYVRKVDQEFCIGCGRCLRVCPMEGREEGRISAVAGKAFAPSYWAAVSKNAEYYHRSASGGVFSSVAEAIIRAGGVVYGCGLDGRLVPSHMRVTSMEDIDRIRRSRYVQSDVGNSFALVKEDLALGKKVLFVGTPCQVSALRSFIGNKLAEGLFLIDLICHGVPSPMLYADNLRYIEKKRGRKLKGYEFRLKQEGCGYAYTYIYTYGNDETGPYYEDAYYNSFYDFLSLNECCYQCPFACLDRPGDITIGDYGWGKAYHAEFSGYEDISCILANTEKGAGMVEMLGTSMHLVPTRIEWILERQNNLKHPEKRPEYRSRIYVEIRQMGYEKWADKYFRSMRYFKKKPIMRLLVRVKIWLNRMAKR